MLTEDLGTSYVLDSYRHRWFKRERDGRVYQFGDIDERGNFYCHPLIGSYTDCEWGSAVTVPGEEMQDMSAFSHPDLGYRHTPNGSGLYHFNRRIGTQRGLYSANLLCSAVARPPNNAALPVQKQVMLVFNGAMMPFVEALAKLNDTNGHVRGFAVTPQFAICRDATNNANPYLLHYNGRVGGTCTRDGEVEFRVGAVKRLFDKVA